MEVDDLRTLTEQLIDSEEHLRRMESNLTTFFNSITELAIIFDISLNIIAFNNATSTLLGYTLTDFKKLTFFDLISHRDLPILSLCIAGIIKEHKSITCQVDMVKSNGDLFPVEIKSSISTWDNGPSIICVARDITDRVKLEQKLAAQAFDLGVFNEELRAIDEELTTRNNFLESMLESIPIPVFYKSVITSKVIDCNKAFVSFYGSTKQYIIGKTSRELFPEYANEFESQDNELLTTDKKIVYFGHVIHNRNMIPNDYIIIKTLHIDHNKLPVGIIGIAVCVHHTLEVDI